MIKRYTLLALILSLFVQSLNAQDEILKLELVEAKVESTIDPVKLARNIARSFSSGYAENFVCDVLHLRSVEMNEQYCEFNGYRGLYGSLDFNQSLTVGESNRADRQYFAPITVMRSYPWDESNNVLKYSKVSTSDSSSFKRMVATNYENNPTNDVMLKKRAIEVASPLNVKMIRFYDFKVEGFYENFQEDQLLKLSFKTRPRFFPDKTPLLCEGVLYYNTTKKIVEYIKLTNYVDFYSVPERDRVYAGILSTKHSLEIYYKQEDGRLYTSKVVMDIDWEDPGIDGDDIVYSYVSNSRPRPYENRLKEKEIFCFENFKFLSRGEAREVKNIVSNLDINELYNAFYKTDFWNNADLDEIDRDRLELELNKGDDTLEGQARKSGISGYRYFWNTDPPHPDRSLKLTPKELKFPEEYYIYTRNFIYPFIFKRDW